MNREIVTLELSRAQALVLFEWLSREDGDKSLPVSDPSEQRVLWLIEGQLERTLVEPLDPKYAELLARARREVNKGH